jgi:hypothetical protein
MAPGTNTLAYYSKARKVCSIDTWRPRSDVSPWQRVRRPSRRRRRERRLPVKSWRTCPSYHRRYKPFWCRLLRSGAKSERVWFRENIFSKHRRYSSWYQLFGVKRDKTVRIVTKHWISIGLSVFRFVANEYQWIAIQLLSTIHNIRSAIRWAVTKVILNYSCLPNFQPSLIYQNEARAYHSLELHLVSFGKDQPSCENIFEWPTCQLIAQKRELSHKKVYGICSCFEQKKLVFRFSIFKTFSILTFRSQLFYFNF